jgi:protein-S-isoprenylcysteine O-methyltransferase Ste14
MGIAWHEVVFILVLLFYHIAIYGPSVHRYRRASKIAEARSRPLDVALDMTVFLAWQALPLVSIFSGWLAFADYQLPLWASILGALLMVCALVLLWRAYRELGRNWSPKIEIGEDQSLVTTGVFGYVRHPIYAGLLLWAAAQPLLIHNWLGGVAMLVVFSLLLAVRIPREEEMMREHFGPAYESYAAKTGRLWPRLG